MPEHGEARKGPSGAPVSICADRTARIRSGPSPDRTGHHVQCRTVLGRGLHDQVARVEGRRRPATERVVHVSSSPCRWAPPRGTQVARSRTGWRSLDGRAPRRGGGQGGLDGARVCRVQYLASTASRPNARRPGSAWCRIPPAPSSGRRARAGTEAGVVRAMRSRGRCPPRLHRLATAAQGRHRGVVDAAVRVSGWSRPPARSASSSTSADAKVRSGRTARTSGAGPRRQRDAGAHGPRQRPGRERGLSRADPTPAARPPADTPGTRHHGHPVTRSRAGALRAVHRRSAPLSSS